MFHGLHLPSTEALGRLGGEAQHLGEPERRPSRGPAGHPAVLWMRKPAARPERSDAEVGGEEPATSVGKDRSSLRAVSDEVRQATGLRALRRHVLADGSRRTPERSRPRRDRAAGEQDEPERQARVPARDDLAEPRRDEGIVCPPGNRGTRRSSDLHEWRNDLGTVSTGDSAKLQYE